LLPTSEASHDCICKHEEANQRARNIIEYRRPLEGFSHFQNACLDFRASNALN